MTAAPGRLVVRAAVRVAAATAIGAAVALAAAPAASAATTTPGHASFHIPNPFSNIGNLLCADPKTPPAPTLPGSGMAGQIAGRPTPPPPPGNPWAKGSRTTEWEQYGFAGLTWNTYDLGCNPLNVPLPELKTMLGGMELGGANAVVAIDINVHDWASGTAWMTTLGPLVTEGTRAVHQALFTPWAGVSLLLLALVLLIRAHRGDFGSAITAFLWALIVLALVAGVTAYPTWAARQVTSLMAGTINSMDAGFVGQRSETAAANGHASLLVSAVLYPQWLAGELGDSISPQARHYGPLLLQAQALTWRRAAASQSQLTATENAKEQQWTAIAGQIKTADPALYPDLQGTQGSRIGIGAMTLADSVIVCGFDIFASLVIVVAELLVLMITVLLPALALVGLHHDTRFAITAVLSRVAGAVASAVLYSVAAGINVRASEFLLSRGSLAVTVTNPLSGFAVMLLQAMLTIALFWAVRKVRVGRLVPSAILYGGMYAAMYAWSGRGGAPAAAAAAGAAPPAGPAATPPPAGPAGPAPPGGPGPAGGPGPGPPGGPPPPPPRRGPGPSPPRDQPPDGTRPGGRPQWPNASGWDSWPTNPAGSGTGPSPVAESPRPGGPGPETQPQWVAAGTDRAGLPPIPPAEAQAEAERLFEPWDDPPAGPANGQTARPADDRWATGWEDDWDDDLKPDSDYRDSPQYRGWASRHPNWASAPVAPPEPPDGPGHIYRGSSALGDDLAGTASGRQQQ